ncbi:MAG TPA: radical SAM family heme chaperone HemW [Gaiellaceae bacterium]|nr:radical SAM family heme chaperone HemW [Gaiellaceae bacterium]
MSGVRHLYVHLPFCAHRCGYCDFVTAVGRRDQHGAYVDALLRELELERGVLARRVETVFVGGGTPTFTEPRALERLLAGLPGSDEVTVEANPETVSPALAGLLSRNRVNRVSIGAQSFQPSLLRVLERRAQPDDVRRAVYVLRDAGFDNISLDLVYGIPGQSAADLAADLAEALALAPEHLSCYELEAKPGTRFTHAHGGELGRQADSMESYFERVVETLTAAGYRWYETANFCRRAGDAGGRDLRAQHNLGYWLGRDYLGLGVGAVSTIDGLRRRNTPRLGPYLAALAHGRRPERDLEPLDEDVRRRERLLLGLRLDEPVQLAGLDGALDLEALARLERLGLAERAGVNGSETVALTTRGRFLGGGVTADLLA